MSSVPRDEPGRQPPARVPSVLRRFARRAETLATDPTFAEAVAAAVTTWNAHCANWNRDYALGFAPLPRRDPPDDPPSEGLVYPPDLDAAEREHNEYARQRWHMPPRLAGLALSGARPTWQNLVSELCERAWPARYFPTDWTFSYPHPGARYVSGCVLWGPNAIERPRDWIAPAPIWPLPYSLLREPGEDPTAARWKAEATAFREALEWLAANGATLTAEDLDALESSAMSRGQAAYDLAFADRRDSHRRYIPLFTGMTAEDWKALRATVAPMLAETDAAIAQHITDLHHDNFDDAAIARLLGIYPRNIKQLLKRGRPP